MNTKIEDLSDVDIDRVIEMGWEDRTPFDAIEAQFGVSETQVITIMRRNLHPRNWRKWRKHVQGRSTKHLKKRVFSGGRHKSRMHRSITLNRISKK